MKDVKDNKEKAKIQPTVIVETAKELLAPSFSGFEAHPGEYHLVKVNGNGEEIPGTDVSVPVVTYNKTFSKLSNYKVKKNPTN